MGPASVVVVLQTNRAWEAATHFHKNDQFQDYSSDLRGFVCLEYRSTRRGEPPVSWNMQEVWKRDEQRETSRRAKLKAQFGIAPQDAWGKLIDCSRNCPFYDIDPR